MSKKYLNKPYIAFICSNAIRYKGFNKKKGDYNKYISNMYQLNHTDTTGCKFVFIEDWDVNLNGEEARMMLKEVYRIEGLNND